MINVLIIYLAQYFQRKKNDAMVKLTLSTQEFKV
jgi:hypothetical protein